MGARIDLTGLRFGHVVVVRQAPTPNKWNELRWITLCDCGKETIKVGNHLRIRGWRIKCCTKDCIYCPTARQGPTKMAVKTHRHRYRAGAKTRALTWELGDEEFFSLTQQSCHYCGSPPVRMVVAEGYDTGIACNGVDRKDNNIGYVSTNVVPCCSFCNYKKGASGYQEFIEWIAKLVTNALTNRGELLR